MRTSEEKRKNDQPRRFPWWLLLVAFALGVIVTLLLTQPVGSVVTSQTQVLAPQSVEVLDTPIPPDVQDMVLTVTPAPLNSPLELNATATTFIVEATQGNS
ncbi:MAG: hypothetical protein H7175_09590 [Burkholderiales bacterium]|nr:hypothetical protein [Anaerolineae bacterium]